MSGISRDRGAAKTALIVTVAVAALGGVAYLMTGNSLLPVTRASAQVQPATFKAVEPPRLAEPPAKPKVQNRELDKVKKGEMVQFRDKAGNVLYRKTELVEGKTGTGKPIHFVMTVRPSPVPLTKSKALGSGKDKIVRKSKSTKPAPKLVFSNGKFTPAEDSGDSGDK